MSMGVISLSLSPQNYFVSGLDEWRSSPDLWPPLGLKSMGYQLTQSGSITTLEDEHVASMLDYHVNPSTTTGVVSRWNLVQHLMKRPVVYSNRAEEGAKSLTFQSAPGSPNRKRLTAIHNLALSA